MSLEKRANKVLEQARELAGQVNSWADFSNRLFDYSGGIVTSTFPDEMERQAFFDSKQHEEINRILIGLMKKTGVVGGAAPKEKSGRFVVRVPKTVHQALETEARCEGVSLNLLAVTKLAMPLTKTSKPSNVDSLIVQAFNAVHEGYSQDWVVVEPFHNRLFIERCRELDLALDEYLLNHYLMNIRKNPRNKGLLNPTTKRSGFKDYDDCAYAAEIAIRTLQRTRGVTLDRTLCDPRYRRQFDDLALALAAGQTELKVRCAALNLRKTHRLQPVDLSSGSYDLVSVGPVKKVSLLDIAKLPGTYAFYDYTRPIFAGETDNLRQRIERHLQKGLPDWIDAKEDEGFVLKTQVLPSTSRDDRLKWLVAFVNKEHPVLNYQKVA